MLALLLLPFFGLAECDITLSLDEMDTVFFNQTVEKGQRICVSSHSADGMVVVVKRAYDTLMKIKSHYIDDIDHEDVSETNIKDTNLLGAIDFGRNKVGTVEFYTKSKDIISFTAFLPSKGCHNKDVRRIVTNKMEDSVVVNNETVCYFNGYSDTTEYDFGDINNAEVYYFENGTKYDVKGGKTTFGPGYVVIFGNDTYTMTVTHKQAALDFTEVNGKLTNSYGIKVLYGSQVKETDLNSATATCLVIFILCIAAAIVGVIIAFVISMLKSKNSQHQMTLEDHPGTFMGDSQAGEVDNDIKSPLVSASPTA